MTIKLSDLPSLPYMPILEEEPEEIYQRWVNRAIALALDRGLPPPPTGEGEYFYDLWYPLALELAEQQMLWTYGFLQGFPIWADSEYLDGHGWAAGLTRKEGESDDTFRLRMLERAATEIGSGRRKDYETWATDMAGVGGAIAREKERHDNSIDLYLTNLNGQPITEEFAETVKAWMWEERRIAGHDLLVHPAPVFNVRLETRLLTSSGTDLTVLAATIQQRVLDYASGRSKLIYNYVAALLLLPGVDDYESLTLNGDVEDIVLPLSSVLRVEVILL
ncbi:baseplate J/gp47 family protein [Paenibacillus sp. FSL R5-0475]|uniref:baseplate J/gp47 family protein n=1 Tax=Paenibacillus sp. FSL R5-0475 TaxID=2921643 RepID=UPI0030FD1EE1